MLRIRRDRYGIPHVSASSIEELFFGQGYATAQDRLWHLTCDRHKALGTLASVTGERSHAVADRFARKARVADAARRGFTELGDDARALCTAHTDGVNAWIARGEPLSSPFARVGAARPDPFEPWQCVAIFLIRHLTFATWQSKLWNARVAAALGPAAMARFCRGGGAVPLIVPPGLVTAMTAFEPPATTDVSALIPLGLDMNGSNSWAVPGAVVAGDPHRALEVPNVYYQIGLSCRDEGIDAVGISFPGVPGIPHFGQTAHTAWGVTNAMADYQDLFIEQLPSALVDVRNEDVAVRGEATQIVECGMTARGPVVIGDTRAGVGLALRSTGLEAPGGSINCVLPQLLAGSVGELDALLVNWIEPVNNFVLADTTGTIGYRTAGRVPLHPLTNAWLPVTDGDWGGCIPDDELPRVVGTGPVVTANQQVTAADYPYVLGINPAAPDRATRIWARISDEPSEVHGDTVHLAALRLAALARGELSDWDGRMDAGSRPAALFALAEAHLVRLLTARLPISLATNPFAADEPPATCSSPAMHVGRALHAWIEADDTWLLDGGESWQSLCVAALRVAAETVDGRTWGDLHHLQPIRLGATDRFDLGPVSGAADCVMATVHIPGATTHALLGSTARYRWDLRDRSRSGWVVPFGASEDEASPHSFDQLQSYTTGRLLPTIVE